MSRDLRVSLAEAARSVESGATIGFGGSGSGVYRRPLEFARELIRQGRKDLDVWGVMNGLETDLLIGAGSVASVSSSYLGLDEMGRGPNFYRAAKHGQIEVHEHAEWLITARFRASNMGLPFMPWLTSRHSDISGELGFSEITCPYTGKRLLAVPAARLDVAVIHVRRCDDRGNVETPSPPDYIYDVDALVARSADRVIVCAEEIGPVDPTRVQLIGREVDAVVNLPRGAWPAGMISLYGPDREHLVDEYIPAAREGNFHDYIDRFVMGGAE